MTQDTQTVFVIHGRNLQARDSLFRFLRSIGLEPLEWSEAIEATQKTSPFIGEVLNAAFSIASAIVILMTPDDEARLLESFRRDDDESYESMLIPQARQNVLFEAGMAMGISPNRTVIVQMGTLRRFTDLDGIHVIKLNNSPQARNELAQRLITAGCKVNVKGTLWLNEGNFDIKQAGASVLPTPVNQKRSKKTAIAISIMTLILAFTVAILYWALIPTKPSVRITTTDLPRDPKGGNDSSTDIAGEVAGADPKEFRVVIYVKTENTWYVQPTVLDPYTTIGQDGKWSTNIHTGISYVALLVRPTFKPQDKVSTLPAVGGDVVAKDEERGK